MTPSFEKPPTIHDVADALGMHMSTVSLALSGKGNVSAATRARVLAVAQELGYEPNPLAQRLARGHQNDLICLFTGDLDTGLTAAKVLAIRQRLNERGLDAPIYVCAGRAGVAESAQALEVRQLRKQRPRAIVCASHRLDNSVLRELAAYQQDGGTVVSYDSEIPLTCDRVLFDREESAYRTARYLLERGHRRIGLGIAAVPRPLAGTPFEPERTRLAGFRRALEEAGVSFREEWVFQGPPFERGGAEIARRFLALRERPTALCLVNDYLALAFMAEVLRAGVRIPEDLSLVGHDNQPVADFCPVPLTSMTHPVEEIADAVTQLLQELIRDGAAPPRTVTSHGELVIRSSAAEWVSGASAA